jgi:hypothetical protein
MIPESEWSKRVAKLLQEALPSLGEIAFESAIKGEGRTLHPDMSARFRQRRVFIEVKTAAASRVSEVLGRLSMAVLQLRRYRKTERDVLLAVLGLDRFGDRLEGEVRAFFRENAPDAGWGLADLGGQAVLEIPALGVSWRREASVRPVGALPQGRRERKLFTDLNRWMLKILLLRHAPENLWGGPRALPRHPTELASIAGVSIETAHRFAHSFEKSGFLRQPSAGLHLVRPRNLLEDWLHQERGEPAQTFNARPLLPAGKTDEPPLPAAATQGAALGGALAAKLCGFLHSSGPHVPLVHLKIPVAEALDAWNLEIADPRDAALRLRQPRFPESVFRGVVRRGEKLAVVDLWQMALDAVAGDSRGMEQAQYILERVLKMQEDA